MHSRTSIDARLAALERKERLRSLNERMAHLSADGYTGSLHSPDDERAIGRDRCETCGGCLRYLGAMVRPESRTNPYSAIGFIDCRSCGKWQEF